MGEWDAPHLVALAAVPGTAVLAIETGVFFRQRKIGAVSAVLFGVGLALWVELFLSLVVHNIDALYPLRGSIVVLLGVPVFAYAVTLIWLAIRWQINALLMLLGGTFGLIGLYYLGGVVLISSVCGISLGGC